jgi:leucyl-tRNA synthetase
MGKEKEKEKEKYCDSSQYWKPVDIYISMYLLFLMCLI